MDYKNEKNIESWGRLNGTNLTRIAGEKMPVITIF
jgi:hypothetical protein